MRSSSPTSAPIAVVGLSCWYPGARDPKQLWENVLARRREFRRIPDVRLPIADYQADDPTAPDKTYGKRAAVIDGFELDWASLRIPKKTFEAMDMAHWLALEVAMRAVEDAGYTRESIPRDKTGVLLGNTLTGEFSRSFMLRYRWPFVRRALEKSAAARGLSAAAARELAETMEGVYKSVFPEGTEDTLAGGLSNTIAGRICNFFDLHGGGFTVDGACASSLIAVITAADKLTSGDLDVALAGGVDISLDTFELVGFAKTGALSPDEMRVYDRRANGFIPGEGSGFVVLKRLEDARAAGDTVYAVLRGWGMSTDGKGGLTAPSRGGQALAIGRAYQRAGFAIGSLDFVEGHGTGTRVGDVVEIEALARAVDENGGAAPRRIGMTSLKSILGHTKAAAGVGAFIKAVLSVNRRVIPATAGCEQPNASFSRWARSIPCWKARCVRPTRSCEPACPPWGSAGSTPTSTHRVRRRPAGLTRRPRRLGRGLAGVHQDTELFVLAAPSVAELRRADRCARSRLPRRQRRPADRSRRTLGQAGGPAPRRSARLSSLRPPTRHVLA